MLPRRRFLQAAALSTTTLTSAISLTHAAEGQDKPGTGRSPEQLDAELNKILDAPVLNIGLIKDPVKIESIELLRDGRHYLLRTRSTSGLEVISVPH